MYRRQHDEKVEYPESNTSGLGRLCILSTRLQVPDMTVEVRSIPWRNGVERDRRSDNVG